MAILVPTSLSRKHGYGPARGLGRNRRPSRATISGLRPELLHFLLQTCHHVGKVHSRRPGLPRKFIIWRPPRLGLRDITNRRHTVMTFRTKKGSLTRRTPHGPFASHIQSSVRDSHHTTTSPAFASDRLWEGGSECTSAKSAHSTATRLAIPTVTIGPNLLSSCPRSVRNRPAKNIPSIPGNGHSLVKLSRPARPYSANVLLLGVRSSDFLPSTDHSSEPLSVPSVLTIQVTGTNCNVQGLRQSSHNQHTITFNDTFIRRHIYGIDTNICLYNSVTTHQTVCTCGEHLLRCMRHIYIITHFNNSQINQSHRGRLFRTGHPVFRTGHSVFRTEPNTQSSEPNRTPSLPNRTALHLQVIGSPSNSPLRLRESPYLPASHSALSV